MPREQACRGSGMSLAVLLFPLLPLTIAAAADLRSRRIPDVAAVCLIANALVASGFGWAGIRPWMVITGILLGLLLGLMLFHWAKLGGGDVKLIVGIGALLGPAGLLFFVFWMAVAGGGLALLALKRGRRDYAYGPAILLGYMAWLWWPGGLF